MALFDPGLEPEWRKRDRQMELNDLIDPIEKILRQAGQMILDADHQALRIEQKGEANYVTEVDYAVQFFIEQQLQALTPAFGFMAEEADQHQAVLDRPFWILDPVDGTTNLMHHFQHSSISLALAEGDDLLMGFVLNPFLNELFIAVRGQGATLNGTPIHVSTVSRLADGLIGFGTSPYVREKAHDTFIRVEKIFLQALEVRRCGTASLDMAYVACGRLDAFFEMSILPWDHAAGLLLVLEAGGRATNLQGQMPSLKHVDTMLASNGLIHDAIYQQIHL